MTEFGIAWNQIWSIVKIDTYNTLQQSIGVKDNCAYLLALTKAVFFLASPTLPMALTFLLKDLTRLSYTARCSGKRGTNSLCSVFSGR